MYRNFCNDILTYSDLRRLYGISKKVWDKIPNLKKIRMMQDHLQRERGSMLNGLLTTAGAVVVGMFLERWIKKTLDENKIKTE